VVANVMLWYLGGFLGYAVWLLGCFGCCCVVLGGV